MKNVYEVTLTRKKVSGAVETWRVDVLARSSLEAPVHASAKVRREAGVTNCIWKVVDVSVIASAPVELRPSRSWEAKAADCNHAGYITREHPTSGETYPYCPACDSWVSL